MIVQLINLNTLCWDFKLETNIERSWGSSPPQNNGNWNYKNPQFRGDPPPPFFPQKGLNISLGWQYVGQSV
jgi:hypothetical protein